MKFIDLMKAKDRRGGDRNRLKNCPYPKDCCTAGYNISTTNGGGVCVGLIHTVNNLDCIRMCHFLADKGKVETVEHFMTPDEAVQTAKCLLGAVDVALELSSSYQKHHEHLCQIRKDGDKSPADKG